jgi:peptidoglycan/xylan/chitin deacetylase (PgdA/CDA1 family)
MEKHNRTIKILFSILALTLACVMFGGSTYLGNAYPKGVHLETLVQGLPTKFDYLKDPANWLLGNAQASAPAASGSSARSVPVLLYHGIFEQENPDAVNWKNFQLQMALLKREGYQTIGLKDLLGFLQHNAPLPEKSFLLTFDDGRKDSYYPADPVLQALGFQAVMFVVAGNLAEDSDFYLGEKEIQTMLASGRWEIGSHGMQTHTTPAIALDGSTGHALSNKLWRLASARLETDEEYAQRIESDLVQSKQLLESRFGVPVFAFAYPYGDYGQNSVNNKEMAEGVIQRAAQTVFSTAFYQPWDRAVFRNYPGTDGFMVGRIEVKPAWTAEDLLARMKGGEDKNLPFTDTLQADMGWADVWGMMEFSTGGMRLFAAGDTTGATAYLGGTYPWSDFDLTIQARLLRGTTFTLLARVDRQGNEVSCTFGRNGVSYAEKFNGADIQGPGWYTDLSLLADLEMRAGISLRGNQVRCLLNNIVRVETPMLQYAGTSGLVGLSVWSPQMGESELRVTGLTATAGK